MPSPRSPVESVYSQGRVLVEKFSHTAAYLSYLLWLKEISGSNYLNPTTANISGRNKRLALTNHDFTSSLVPLGELLVEPFEELRYGRSLRGNNRASDQPKRPHDPIRFEQLVQQYWSTVVSAEQPAVDMRKFGFSTSMVDKVLSANLDLKSIEELVALKREVFKPKRRINQALEHDQDRLILRSDNVTPELLERLLSKTLGKLLLATEYSLEFGIKESINNHGLAHVSSLLQGARELVKVLGWDSNQHKKLIVAIWFHDLANLFGRENHAVGSAELFRSWAKAHLAISSDDEYEIYEAILLHDGATVTAVAEANKLRGYQVLQSASPMTHVLRLLDKTDIGSHRLPRRSLMAGRDKAPQENDYRAVDSVWTTPTMPMQQIAYNSNEQSWDLTLAFDVRNRLPEVMQKSEQSESVIAPDRIIKYHKAEGVPWMCLYVHETLRVYKGRLAEAIASIIALDPTCQIVTFHFVDDEIGMEITVEIGIGGKMRSREDLQSMLNSALRQLPNPSNPRTGNQSFHYSFQKFVNSNRPRVTGALNLTLESNAINPPLTSGTTRVSFLLRPQVDTHGMEVPYTSYQVDFWKQILQPHQVHR